MDRVLFCPSRGTWSIAPGSSFPFTFNFPTGAQAGNIFFTVTSSGSTPVNGQGAIVTVTIDGVPTVSGCLENGSGSVPVPANAVSVTISNVKGCNGGPDTTNVNYSGAGP